MQGTRGDPIVIDDDDDDDLWQIPDDVLTPDDALHEGMYLHAVYENDFAKLERLYARDCAWDNTLVIAIIEAGSLRMYEWLLVTLYGGERIEKLDFAPLAIATFTRTIRDGPEKMAYLCYAFANRLHQWIVHVIPSASEVAMRKQIDIGMRFGRDVYSSPFVVEVVRIAKANGWALPCPDTSPLVLLATTATERRVTPSRTPPCKRLRTLSYAASLL